MAKKTATEQEISPELRAAAALFKEQERRIVQGIDQIIAAGGADDPWLETAKRRLHRGFFALYLGLMSADEADALDAKDAD